MSGVKCQYFNCGKSKRLFPTTVFHCFPTENSEISRQWIINSGNASLESLPEKTLQNRRLCSDHFDTSMYRNKKRRLLTSEAVPLPHPSISTFGEDNAVEEKPELGTDGSTCFVALPIIETEVKDEQPIVIEEDDSLQLKTENAADCCDTDDTLTCYREAEAIDIKEDTIFTDSAVEKKPELGIDDSTGFVALPVIETEFKDKQPIDIEEDTIWEDDSLQLKTEPVADCCDTDDTLTEAEAIDIKEDTIFTDNAVEEKPELGIDGSTCFVTLPVIETEVKDELPIIIEEDAFWKDRDGSVKPEPDVEGSDENQRHTDVGDRLPVNAGSLEKGGKLQQHDTLPYIRNNEFPTVPTTLRNALRTYNRKTPYMHNNTTFNPIFKQDNGYLCDHCGELFQYEILLDIHRFTVRKVNALIKHRLTHGATSKQVQDGSTKPKSDEVVKNIENHREADGTVEEPPTTIELNEEDEQSQPTPSEESLLTCKTCFKLFSVPSNLNQDVCSPCSSLSPISYPRERLKLYLCHKCGDSFHCASTLKKHLILHDNSKKIKYEYPRERLKPHLCHKCGDSFHYASTLKKHLILHDNSNSFEEKTLTCRKCFKQFSDPSILSTVARTYSKVNTYTCCSCSELQKLMESDEMETVYSCQYCGNSYIDYQIFKKHLFAHDEARIFSCEICGKSFVGYKSFKRHSHKQFTCNVCSKSFRGKKSLINHLRFHNGEWPHVCSICKRKMASAHNLKLHLAKHERFYACKICDKTFTKNNNLRLHMISHDEKRPSYTCDTCAMSFSVKAYLVSHFRVHSGERPFECKICNKKFSRNSRLTVHVRCHNGEKPFACKICEKSFSTSGNMMRHQRTHTNERPYSCDICGNSFSQKTVLASHLKTRCGEKPFACSCCLRRFSKKRALISHLKRDSVKKKSCNSCNRRFSSRANLEKHVQRVHSKNRAYTCEICGRSFSTKGYLVVHLRIHTGEKRYACSSCDKKFLFACSFKSHLRAHGIELPSRPHICEKCQRSFKSSSALRWHQTTHRKKKAVYL